jgi:hypothetical protein
VERILASLQDLALVHRAEPPHGTPAGKQRYYLPVGSLKDVVGIYPAGLGRSYTELVRLQPAFAQRAVQLVSELHRRGVAIHGATTPMEAALALQHWTSSPEALQDILSTAPERTTALLAKFRNWAMGAVPQAQRKASITTEGSDVGPVDWLLARGLLVPLDAAHVELPHSVGLSLRGGAIINDFTLSPPVPELGRTSAALRRNAALGAIAETLRLVGEMLHAVKEQPLATLRSGGVGVREMRRLADVLRIDQLRVGLLLELCGLAGLIRLDVDSSSWIQPPELEWLVLPRQEQWLWLVNAWLASERVPSMVGQPISGTPGAAAGHRAASGSTVIALSAEAQRPDAPVVRKRILEILNELTQEAAAPDGTAPVLDAAAVLQRAEWAQPRMARRFSSLIRGVLAEAEILGLLGSGALSQLGSAIAADDPDAALAILGEHLPAELNHVLLQADLTAVAPGYLAPVLTEKLLLMADAEGQGPATIYRFSPGSIRRALDAGQVPRPCWSSCGNTQPRPSRSRCSTSWRTRPPGTAGCGWAAPRALSKARTRVRCLTCCRVPKPRGSAWCGSLPRSSSLPLPHVKQRRCYAAWASRHRWTNPNSPYSGSGASLRRTVLPGPCTPPRGRRRKRRKSRLNWTCSATALPPS